MGRRWLGGGGEVVFDAGDGWGGADFSAIDGGEVVFDVGDGWGGADFSAIDGGEVIFDVGEGWGGFGFSGTEVGEGGFDVEAAEAVTAGAFLRIDPALRAGTGFGPLFVRGEGL